MLRAPPFPEETYIIIHVRLGIKPCHDRAKRGLCSHSALLLRVYFLLAITPYIEGIRLERKAGLLTLFHISGTFPPLGSGVVARVHNGTHSCGTVGDLHLVPFLIASIANLCAAKLRIFYELTKKSHLFYQKICVIRQNCLILQRK
jgi:hypothetical protein